MQKNINLITQVHPQVVAEAGVALLAVTFAAAEGGIGALIHGLNDLSHADVLGSPPQMIPSTGPAHTAYQVIVAQL